MKHFLLSILVLSLGFLSSCKKNKSLQPTLPVIEASITFSGRTNTALTSSLASSNGSYEQRAAASSGSSFTITYTVKPSGSSTFDLGTSTNVKILITDSSGNTWLATSGTLSVSPNGNYLSANFTNTTFLNQEDGMTTALGSGYITC